MSASIKQIAEQTGLSEPSVRHILGNQAHKYHPDTCRRVREAALQLGYRANASARSMRTGRFGCVALVRSATSRHSTLFRGLLEGIEDALAEHDLHLTVARLSDRTLTDPEAVPKILRQWMADGLLLNYQQDIPARMQELIERHRLPSVWINSRHAADCVHPDDLAAGRAAAEHLLGLGHARIAYGTIPTTHYSAADRRAGHEAALGAAGLAPRVLTHAGDTSDGIPLWRETLSRPDRPTAVIAYMPHVAQAVFYAALMLGLRVPQDLSLSVFDMSPLKATGLPVTTWVIPDYAMGQGAVEMLVQKITAPAAPLPPRVLPLGFAPGQTCAPPGG